MPNKVTQQNHYIFIYKAGIGYWTRLMLEYRARLVPGYWIRLVLGFWTRLKLMLKYHHSNTITYSSIIFQPSSLNHQFSIPIRVGRFAKFHDIPILNTVINFRLLSYVKHYRKKGFRCLIFKSRPSKIKNDYHQIFKCDTFKELP